MKHLVLGNQRGYWNSVVFAITFVGVAINAGAAPILINGNFDNVGSNASSFSISYHGASSFDLPGWTVGNPPTGTTATGNKILQCAVMGGSNTNVCGSLAFGGGLSFWVNPGASPLGGTYLAIDGDQAFSYPIFQTVTGLTPGHNYYVSFYQASAQQSGFSGATTEWWQVKLGIDSQLSTVMSTPSHGSVGWNYQQMTFTATAASEILQFIAWGTPSGVPPFVLLDGVAVAEAPEPLSYGLVGFGLLCFRAIKKWRTKTY